MSAVDIFLIGLAWILIAALIFGVVAMALMITVMQTNERTKSYGQEEKAQPENHRYPAPKHRRRRTAGSYPCQMP